MRRALATAALGVALCLAGATVDTPSLYVAGIGLGTLAIGAVAWVRLAASGARVERFAGPATVEEEQPWPLRLSVLAGRVLPPGGELLEPLLGWPIPIAGRWSRRVRLNVRFARRGRRVLEPPTLVIRDMLGLMQVEVAAGGPAQEVLVLPRVEPLEAPPGGTAPGGLQAGGAGARGAGGRLEAVSAELEIDGLRPYRDGAPATRIHWPAVARTGEMVERRLVAEPGSLPLVVLDAAAPASAEALDAAVRATASICRHLAVRGGCAVLLPGDRRAVVVRSDLAAWPALHVRLALVEATLRPPSASADGRGVVFWVTGAAGRRPPPALQRTRARVRWLVRPAPLPGREPEFAVAGCVGQRLERAPRYARAVA